MRNVAERGPSSVMRALAAARVFGAFALLGLSFLAGCSTSSLNIATKSPLLPATTKGRGAVHGGQQPVSGSTVQL